MFLRRALVVLTLLVLCALPGVAQAQTAGPTTIEIGGTALAVAVNPVTNRAYVARFRTSSGMPTAVLVIDGATNTVVATVPVPDVGFAITALAVNPATNKVYLSAVNGAFRVMDGATNTLDPSPPLVLGQFNSIGTGLGMGLFGLNPNTNKVYVGNSGGVAVIDGTSSAVTATIAPPGWGQMGWNVAVNPGTSPSTNRVYAMVMGTVFVINGATNAFVTSIPVSQGVGLAVNPTTNTVYVTQPQLSTVSVIDGAINTVTATFPAGGSPSYGVAVNPVTNYVYVANRLVPGGTVTVTDGATNLPVATFAAGWMPYGVAVNSVTNTVYVTNQASTFLSVFPGLTRVSPTQMLDALTGYVSSPAPSGPGLSNPALNNLLNPLQNALAKLHSPSTGDDVVACNELHNFINVKVPNYFPSATDPVRIKLLADAQAILDALTPTPCTP